jgi:hypothetical protein
MHFPKGQTPPARGFWSLTKYDDDCFFVKNPLNRFTLSPRNALKYNEDGSLDFYLQKDSPGRGHPGLGSRVTPSRMVSGMIIRLFSVL